MNRPIPRSDYERFLNLAAEKRRRAAKIEHCTRGYRDEDGVWRGGLLAFVRYFWHLLEPGTKFKDGWALEAICEHLEAVTFGEVTKLLINVPPGFMKSLLTDVFWPAWEWGPMQMPHVRYVAFSYSSSLTERDNEKFAVLCGSAEYQAMYSDQVQLRRAGSKKVSNGKHGWKLATSVGGVGTGERGDRIILDDPHNVKESESEVVRTETVRWFWESMSSRLNDMENGAKVVIMQRVHAGDVSGEIIEKGDWCHLMIPMEYVWQADKKGQPYANDIGWVDPRWQEDPEECDGELAWPERFPERIIPSMKKDAGTHAWSGQYQQTPRVRGGAIFDEADWMPWEPVDGKFPQLTYVVASLDGAYTEKEENDPSALVVGGIFEDENGNNRCIIMHAWRKKLKFSGPKVVPEPGESTIALKARTQKSWGLVEWVADTCKRFNVDRLLIEAKATGISAAQVLGNSHPTAGWSIQMVDPKGDKVARALSVQPAWTQQLVYIPFPYRQWGQDLVDEMADFPKAKTDDMTDACTQLIKHFRDVGLLRNDEEVRVAQTRAIEQDQAKHKRAGKKLYPGSRTKAVA